MATSDLLQYPATRAFLLEKKAKALSVRHANDQIDKTVMFRDLKCIEDDLEWRIRGAIKGIEGSHDRFWPLLETWEKISILKPIGKC